MQKSPHHLGFGDQDVHCRVESYLESRHFPGFKDLQIDVHEGIVTLSGKVDNFHERQIAVNSCRRVAGVIRLIDEIEVGLEDTAVGLEESAEV